MEEGSFLDEAVDTCFSKSRVPETLKGLIYQVASGAIRQKGYFDWVLAKLVIPPAPPFEKGGEEGSLARGGRRNPLIRKGGSVHGKQRKHVESMKKDVRYLLWISLFQIAFMKKAHYHVVMEAVEYAKSQRGKGVANFVNAVLRRFIREKESISFPADPARRLSILYSFPQWLVERWLARFGTEDTERLLILLNEAPDFTIRIDLSAVSRNEVIEELEANGVRTSKGRFLESALGVDRLGPVLNSRLFKEKRITVQDETSQLVASALTPHKGSLILDACAGLGTKTAQLRQSFPGSIVVAMDNSVSRLGIDGVKTNLVRADGLQTPFRNAVFDTILLDAPCSSIGIIRKHPEIRWRRKKEDIASFGKYQLDLLRSLWDNLKTEGNLIYSVCSFEPEETVEILERFAKEKAFVLESPFSFMPAGDYFLSVPHKTGMDGFFIARLKKL